MSGALAAVSLNYRLLHDAGEISIAANVAAASPYARSTSIMISKNTRLRSDVAVAWKEWEESKLDTDRPNPGTGTGIGLGPGPELGPIQVRSVFARIGGSRVQTLGATSVLYAWASILKSTVHIWWYV